MWLIGKRERETLVSEARGWLSNGGDGDESPRKRRGGGDEGEVDDGEGGSHRRSDSTQECGISPDKRVHNREGSQGRSPDGKWLVGKHERGLMRHSLSPNKPPSCSPRSTTGGSSRRHRPTLLGQPPSTPGSNDNEDAGGDDDDDQGGGGDGGGEASSGADTWMDGEPCALCGSQMLARRGRYGLFWGCSSFRALGCKYTRRPRKPGASGPGGLPCVVFEMDARVCSALVERSERGGRRVDRRGGGGEADGESAGGNGEKSSGEGRGDEGVVASIDGDAGGEKQGDDDGSLTEQGGGAEFRAYIWRAMCGPASAAAIGGRSAGDECEESSLRALLRRACLRPLRCDWRDDGVYGAVFPLSEYEVVKAVISKHADVTGLPPAALAFFRSAPVGAAGVLGGEDWRTRLTPALRSSLLPFQEEGVVYALSRGGRVLIADEMGLGKTVQALATTCALDAWPLLVVAPATLRLVWAEEIEKWLAPLCPPSCIRVIFGSSDKLDSASPPPKVVITSYNMLRVLRGELLSVKWGCVILDESHCVRTTLRGEEVSQTLAAMEAAQLAPHCLMLSGTPSLCAPLDLFHQVHALRRGLLGSDKVSFDMHYGSASGGDGGACGRAWELNMMLKESVMVRRLKADVLAQLPAKRRQLVPVMVSGGGAGSSPTKPDPLPRRRGAFAPDTRRMGAFPAEQGGKGREEEEEELGGRSKYSKYRAAGLGKLEEGTKWLRGFLSNCGPASGKIVVFAHHRAVMDACSLALGQSGIGFVRLDGSTPMRLRLASLNTLKNDAAMRVGLVSVTAGGQGIDLSFAQSAVFMEIPPDCGWVRQAEDRLHRRGQEGSVHIYYLVARAGVDASSRAQELEDYDTRRWAAVVRGITVLTAVTDGPASSEGLNAHEVRGSGAGCEEEAGEGAASLGAADGCEEGQEDEEEEDEEDDEEWGLGRVLIEPAPLCEEPPPLEEPPLLECEEPQPRECAREEAGTRRGAEEWASCSRFLVSSHTGRVHLMRKDGTPQGISMPVALLRSSRPHAEEVMELARQQVVGLTVDGLALAVEAMVCFAKAYVRLSPHEKRGLRGMLLGASKLPPLARALPTSAPVEPTAGQCPTPSPTQGSAKRSATASPCSAKRSATASPCSAMCAPARGQAPASPCASGDASKAKRTLGLVGSPRQSQSASPQKPQTAAGALMGASASLVTGDAGGSTRRITPRGEHPGAPPPDGAEWMSVSVSLPHHKAALKYDLALAPGSGDPLCLFCMKALGSRFFYEPLRRALSGGALLHHELFCSGACVGSYFQRTSVGSMRRQLFELEQGVCQSCGLDCAALLSSIRSLPHEGVEEILMAAPAGGGGFAAHPALLRLVCSTPVEGNLWHADHKVAVWEGGGECGIDNMRTLCVCCHAVVTAGQAGERARKRARVGAADGGGGVKGN